MAEQQYDLFFSGQLLDGHFTDFVKADIKQLFKADDAYVNALFSGKEQVIKAKVDKATAIKYQQAFKKAGAKLIVKAHSAQVTQQTAHQASNKMTPTSPSVSKPVAPKPTVTASTGPLSLTTQPSQGENSADLIENHQADIHAPSAVPNWDVSAPGVQLVEATVFQPANIDTSDITVADVGANLIAQQGFEEPTPFIDTSSISLAKAGGFIETLDDKPAPVRVDISHLRLE